MTNMSIPVAPGIGGSEPLVIGTAMKLVLYHWETGCLMRKSIMKVAQGNWMLGRGHRKPLASPSRCLFLCISCTSLHPHNFHFFFFFLLFIASLFFFFKHLYWSIIALQWSVSFCFITKWISYTYTYVPISLTSCVSLPPTLPIPPL